MSKTNNIFYLIDNFIVEKIFSKKVTPFLYFLYMSFALFIVRRDIGKVPATYYLSVIAVGLLALFGAISGIRDKIYFAYSVQATKRDAHFTGYFALIIAIIILVILHYRESIFR